MRVTKALPGSGVPTTWAMLACVLAMLCGHWQARADGGAVLGLWLEPSGGIIHVYQCGDRVCARLVGFGQNNDATTDEKNPDTALRSRPLCNLLLGQGFRLKDREHAENGYIYDPRHGRTYSAVMTAEGDILKLRGFIGVELFGRTEVWKRVANLQMPCPNR